jgi:methyltransferase (TIGR00027 family)
MVSGMDQLGLTSRWAAAGRARESDRSDRLFTDPLATILAGESGFALLDEMSPGHGRENTTFAVRTRFFDDLVTSATDAGIRQVVLIAAGMDTRAYRLRWPDATSLFEVDQPQVLAVKQQILDDQQTQPACRCVTVSADLAGGWTAAVKASGFQTGQAAVFVAEGLMMYLPEPAVGHVLDQVSTLATEGSILGVDVQSRASIEHPWMADWLRKAASKGMGWQFGTDNPVDLLAAHGWRANVTEFADVARSLGRYPTDPIPDAIAADVAAVSRAFLIDARPTS